MSGSGFSTAGLARMHGVLAGYVERGDIAGMVALMSHGDDVRVEVLGTLAFGEAAPMERDTIFRMASLTKVVTAVAGLMLLENCRLRLVGWSQR